MKTFEELTTTTQTAEWIPTETWAKLILEGAWEARKLSPAVAAVSYNKNAGEGSNIEVRYFPARTAQGPITEGNALSATSSDPTVKAITIAKYGDYDLVTGETFEDTSDDFKARLVNSMGYAIGEKLDDIVYTELETATPGSSKTLTTKGDGTSLYDKVVELRGDMLAAKVRPDTLIIHPDYEASLLKETVQGVRGNMVTVGNDGHIDRVAGLNVIVSAAANASAATTHIVQAIVIDSTRAVGEAYGRPLEFKTAEPDIEYDRTKVVCWIRYGADELDTAGIGHIVNADS